MGLEAKNEAHASLSKTHKLQEILKISNIYEFSTTKIKFELNKTNFSIQYTKLQILIQLHKVEIQRSD